MHSRDTADILPNRASAPAGKFVIRFQVGQTSTTREDVLLAWDVIRELAAGL